jgi:hypothetical protein
MDTELKLDLASVKDESLPGRDGTFDRVKRYTFFLGKYGPFVERIPIDDPNPTEFSTRVTKLRAQLITQQQ